MKPSLLILILNFISISLFAQEPKKEHTKVYDKLDSLSESIDKYTKEHHGKSESKTSAEEIAAFMRQFDNYDMDYWAGKVKKCGSPMADSFGLWLNRLQNNDFNGIDKPNALPILEADKMDFKNGNYTGYGEVYEDGAYIELRYLRSNKNSERIYKKIKKAFAQILKDPAYKLSNDADNYAIILKNNLVVLDYYAYDDKEDKSNEDYLILIIQNPKFPKIFIADEAQYNGNFPSTIKDTDAPQIWQVKGENDAQWYQRYNGIFKDGILVKGSKTFKGYGGFYDGTWYAKDWSKSCKVVFLPANSKDTVWGAFSDIDMDSYTADSRYSSLKGKRGEFRPDAPAWVNNVLPYLYEHKEEHENIAKNLIRKTDKKHLEIGNLNDADLATIKGIQQNMFLLIGMAALGFKSYEKTEKERSGQSVFYYSKSNSLMASNEEVIESTGTKTNYIAAYRTTEIRKASMLAFLALPSVNKSNMGLKLEQEKNVDATEVQQINLYFSNKLVATYSKFLKQDLSVIKVYQLSF